MPRMNQLCRKPKLREIILFHLSCRKIIRMPKRMFQIWLIHRKKLRTLRNWRTSAVN